MLWSAFLGSIKVLSRFYLESTLVSSAQKPSMTPHCSLNKIQISQLALFQTCPQPSHLQDRAILSVSKNSTSKGLEAGKCRGYLGYSQWEVPGWMGVGVPEDWVHIYHIQHCRVLEILGCVYFTELLSVQDTGYWRETKINNSPSPSPSPQLLWDLGWWTIAAES